MSIKQIDNLTKDELIAAIDYLRSGGKNNQLQEEFITKLAEKFGANLKGAKSTIANKFETLVDKTKTKDVSGRVPAFTVSKLK